MYRTGVASTPPQEEEAQIQREMNLDQPSEPAVAGKSPLLGRHHRTLGHIGAANSRPIKRNQRLSNSMRPATRPKLRDINPGSQERVSQIVSLQLYRCALCSCQI